MGDVMSGEGNAWSSCNRDVRRSNVSVRLHRVL